MFRITQDTETKRYTLEKLVYSADTHTNQSLYTLYNVQKQDLARYLQREGVNAMAVLENTGRPTVLTNSGGDE